MSVRFADVKGNCFIAGIISYSAPRLYVGRERDSWLIRPCGNSHSRTAPRFKNGWNFASTPSLCTGTTIPVLYVDLMWAGIAQSA